MPFAISTLCWCNRRKTRYCANTVYLCNSITLRKTEISSNCSAGSRWCTEHIFLADVGVYVKQRLCTYYFWSIAKLGSITLPEEPITRTNSNLLWVYVGEKAFLQRHNIMRSFPGDDLSLNDCATERRISYFPSAKSGTPTYPACNFIHLTSMQLFSFGNITVSYDIIFITQAWFWTRDYSGPSLLPRTKNRATTPASNIIPNVSLYS